MTKMETQSAAPPPSPRTYWPTVFDERLGLAISDALSSLADRRVSVLPPESGGQTWYVSRLYGYPRNLCYPIPAGPQATKYLADSLLGFSKPGPRRGLKRTLLTATRHSPWAQQRMSRPVFDLHHDGPVDDDMLILPCTRVVRVIDFQASLVTVHVRPGLDAGFMLSDIDRRSGSHSGPFPRIVAFADDGRWFREEFVAGSPLPRIAADGEERHRLMLQALSRLEAWQASTMQSVDTVSHLNRLADSIEQRLDLVRPRTSDDLRSLPRPLVRAVTEAAKAVPSLSTVIAHRDLGPNNVLVRSDSSVVILDWEFSARSMEYYDRLRLALDALDLLSAPGFDLRMQAFLGGQAGGDFLDGLPTDRSWRTVVGGIFALELAAWLLDMIRDHSTVYIRELQHHLELLHTIDWRREL